MKRFFALILTIAAALSLTACGKSDGGASAPAASVGNASEPAMKSEAPAPVPPDETPSGNGGGDEGREESSDRHYYKSVTFYGYLEQMISDYTGSSGCGDHAGAVSLTYDTSAGRIENIRVVDYIDTAIDEDEQQERIKNKVERSGKKFSALPYKTEKFTNYRDNEITAMIWETNDLKLINFESHIYAFFIDRDLYDGSPKQDIDGLIKSIFYDDMTNRRGRPLPYFDDNAFCFNETALFAISFTDDLWSIKDPDKWSDKLHFNASTPDDVRNSFDPAEYGSTSYNTGGGYTGTYNCKDYLDKEN